MSETVLEALESLMDKALEYNQNSLCAPVALLWPDKEERWAPVIDLLRENRRVVTLGEVKEGVSGPAYWIRCAVEGTVPVDGPEGTPIVYLPGLEREDLRAVEEAPDRVAPIAELQYRGEWFSAPNGSDWTPWSLFTDGEVGLGLKISDATEAVTALQHALPSLVRQPLARMTAKYLDTADLNEIVNPEPLRAVLEWLDDPAGQRERMAEAGSWKAFTQQCKAELGFDPDADGVLTAAEYLGRREGTWEHVWARFREAPSAYSGIPARLRQARPADLPLTAARDSWPQDNEDDENRLRAALEKLPESSPAEARAIVASVWDEHQDRRGWVWAELDQAPLVFALEHLSRLAEMTGTPIPEGEVEDLIAGYSDAGWKVDAASMQALASASEKADRAALAVSVDVLYRPWAHEIARRFQEGVGPEANSGKYTASPALDVVGDVVFVFVDGLRLDLGHALEETLTNAGLKVELVPRLAPLPTVTQTCKPALAPIAAGELGPGSALDAARADSGAKAGIEVLRRLMSDGGVQILLADEAGDSTGCAWTEVGEIDRRGHDGGFALVDAVGAELDAIAKRVRHLLDDGWPQVQIVTDHGWLLLPGGMEKVSLPAAATETKKGRCARLKEGAEVEVTSVPWHWDENVRIAIAPGVTCFEEGKRYEHGGVSPQECVVPHLMVSLGKASSATQGPEVTGVKWLGLLCRVEYSGVGPGGSVDIRGLPTDPSTSVAEAATETTGAGKASLIVPDEDQQGEEAYIVIVSASEELLAQRKVSIGQNR